MLSRLIEVTPEPGITSISNESTCSVGSELKKVLKLNGEKEAESEIQRTPDWTEIGDPNS